MKSESRCAVEGCWARKRDGEVCTTHSASITHVFRPQRKKDKKVKEMLGALKTGDRICTIGGIYGTIVAIKDDTVTLAVGSAKTQVVMARWAIRSVEDAPVENDSEPQV